MVRLGNFFFHFRNFLFPIFYCLLFIPSSQLIANWKLALIMGLIVAASGQVLRVATIGLVYIIRGGKNRRIYADGLVTTGLFSHCRNPLYVGNIFILIGLGIMSNSLLFMIIIVPLFLFMYQAIVMAEENFLHSKFGDSYEAYMGNTNRWFPKLAGIGETLSSMTFNWKRVFIREYTTAYIWMSGAVLLVLRQVYMESGPAAVKHNSELFIGALVLLLICYLIVRYMKKSKKWTAD